MAATTMHNGPSSTAALLEEEALDSLAAGDDGSTQAGILGSAGRQLDACLRYLAEVVQSACLHHLAVRKSLPNSSKPSLQGTRNIAYIDTGTGTHPRL